MKKVLVSLVIAFSSVDATACPHALVGRWKSDKAASMDFARSHSRFEPKTEAFLGALMGHMVITFDEHEIKFSMPDIKVPVAGEPKPFKGHEEREPYQVLFCNAFSVVISAKRPFGRDQEATTLQFVDENNFWIYTGGTSPTVPDLHTREFFRRLP